MSTAVFVPASPAPEHLLGLADILDALACYEPETQSVLVICDGNAATLDPVIAGSSAHVDVGLHPRSGRGNPLLGGDCVGMLEAIRIMASDPPDVLVRLDCDALVIGQSFARLEAFTAAHPSVGIVGSFREDAQVSAVARAARRLSLPVALWRDPPRGHPRLMQLLFGPNAVVRKWMRRARRAGWDPGSHCQGGAFALSGGFITALRGEGLLDRPLDWLGVPLPSDVMLAALAAALGFELADLSGPGEPFGVEHRGLPDIPERLVETGRSLIHSLKSEPGGRTQTEVRRYYADRRLAGGWRR